MSRYTRIVISLALFSLASVALGADAKHEFFTAADGKKLHYATLGTQGTPVILIHGSGGSCETWLQNGIADSLAKTHIVYAIDMRGHGKSDGPRDSGDMAGDVIAFMDAKKIDKAHIHGYSMGGGITGRLMARIPNRFITGSFGGSGVRETDEWREKVPADKEGRDPQEAQASATFNARQQEARAAVDGPGAAKAKGAAKSDGTAKAAKAGGKSATKGQAAKGADDGKAKGRTAGAGQAALDLSTIKFPVMAVNGEFDSPLGKTHRLWRELPDFTNVVLPGKSHLTAVYPGYCPPLYVNSLTAFINSNDPKK